jgi:hypothetical protein
VPETVVGSSEENERLGADELAAKPIGRLGLGHADDGGVVVVMAEVLEQGGDGVLLAECHLDLRVLVVERRQERPGRCGDTRDRSHADASANDARGGG